MKEEVFAQISLIIKDIYSDLGDCEVELSQPEEKFGDFSCNIAMKIAKKSGGNPREIADKVAHAVNSSGHGLVASVAGPGFINLSIADGKLIGWINKPLVAPKIYSNQKVIVEYSDPNPFKPLHAGHLYTTLVGDSISRIVEYAGAEVIRINYSGDVGLHVAKSMWAIIKNLGGESFSKLAVTAGENQTSWLGDRYIEGSSAYEDDEKAKTEIIAINKKVYALHENNDTTSEFAQIYWQCREWSYEYFKSLYERLGTAPFDRFITESEVTKLGLDTVKEQEKKGVYQESDQAIIYKAEEVGLHTRVFINSAGLPTYEAKEVGLVLTKWRDYHYDRSIIITANEQEQYMQVVLASVKQFAAEPVQRTNHLTHGMVKLAGGQKMSSRKGNILSAVDVIDTAEAVSRDKFNNEDVDIAVGSIKYSFAKQRIGGDIIYDPISSVNIHGDSGPYLQYALVRAKSILKNNDESARS